ncbi:glycosyltransferase family 39 protein [Oscillatoria sp. FACHB-1406]|uniref:glycosyltransferase family 39 protein n=1 Tax=Oscillatoria sp. FACHB-1406 TaxID=2692846 RepID=UPI0016845AC2|nr:glycosyltransferase family 39 protein [Oscillatoria sp. FACHB-1406]MBD2579558.1 glycosyltransferase family 39 protein [Oscillatoria sp. FACHB-1406]
MSVRYSLNKLISRSSAPKNNRWLVVIGILAMGLALRWARLATKPLWADEIFTAIFSLGQSMEEIPTGQFIPLDRLTAIFQLKPETNCAEIAHHLATQSTHPPLFFCAMHQWLTWLEPFNLPLAWKLRALPAIWGTAAIAAIYLLNRQAFSPRAGLFGAAFAAVSPFGIYQSQEARHYTLPILLIALSLIFLLEMQKSHQSALRRYGMALGWAATHTLSLYVHYFCAIAFIAQILTLVICGLRISKKQENGEDRLPITNYELRTTNYKIWQLLPFSLLPPLLYLPWLPVAIAHFSSPKSDWLPKPQHIVPLLQTVMAMLLTIVAPPVESQPLAIVIPAIAFTLLFLGWFLPRAYRGFKLLLAAPDTRDNAFTLACFIALVLLQLLAIVYLLGKDITIAPRYHFIYYPAFCALLAASVTAIQNSTAPEAEKSPRSPERLKFSIVHNRLSIILLTVSFLSSLFVIFNLAFQKPYHPLPVAKTLDKPSGSVAIAMGYSDNQEIAIGLSYALALKEIGQKSPPANWLFLDSSQGYERVWALLSEQSVAPDFLWVFAPGLIEAQYPPSLEVGEKIRCTQQSGESYRVGIPYQLYRCPSAQ